MVPDECLERGHDLKAEQDGARCSRCDEFYPFGKDLGGSPPAPDGFAVTDGQEGVHVEEYTEWRLSGQPDGGYPFYDLTFQDRERVEQLMHIWSKVKSGEYDWSGAKLQHRTVTITKTAWVDEDADSVRPER